MELNQNLCKAVSKHSISIGRNGCYRVMVEPMVRTARKLLTAFKLMFSKPLERICMMRFL